MAFSIWKTRYSFFVFFSPHFTIAVYISFWFDGNSFYLVIWIYFLDISNKTSTSSWIKMPSYRSHSKWIPKWGLLFTLYKSPNPKNPQNVKIRKLAKIWQLIIFALFLIQATHKSRLFRIGTLCNNLDINTCHLLNLCLSLFLNLTVLLVMLATNIEIWNIFTLKETVDLYNEWKSCEWILVMNWFWRLIIFFTNTVVCIKLG